MNKNELNRALLAVIEMLAHTPASQILYELGLITSRIRFIPAAESMLTQDDVDQVKAALHFLFEQDVSPQMKAFIEHLAEERSTVVLLPEQAGTFIGLVDRYLQTKSECKVVTAVPCSAGAQMKISEQIGRHHQNARVVFEVLPSLLGGCLIVDEEGRSFDYSFKTNIGLHARKYFNDKLKQLKQT